MESTLLGNMVHLLNVLAEGSLLNKNVTEYKGESISLKGSVLHNISEDLYVTIRDAPENTTVINLDDKTPVNMTAQIKIPAETLVEKQLTESTFFSYAFKDNRFFVKSDNTNFHRNRRQQNIQSIIMSLKFINKSVIDLEHPIQLNFETLDYTDTSSSECSFWKQGVATF